MNPSLSSVFYFDNASEINIADENKVDFSSAVEA